MMTNKHSRVPLKDQSEIPIEERRQIAIAKLRRYTTKWRKNYPDRHDLPVWEWAQISEDVGKQAEKVCGLFNLHADKM